MAAANGVLTDSSVNDWIWTVFTGLLCYNDEHTVYGKVYDSRTSEDLYLSCYVCITFVLETTWRARYTVCPFFCNEIEEGILISSESCRSSVLRCNSATQSSIEN